MTAEAGVSESPVAVDSVLKEVDLQVRKLDECVGKLAIQMLEADDDASIRLIDQALDANKKSCILAELRVLLQDQKRKEGGHTHVPQAVVDLLEMGRSSCNYHVERAFGHVVFDSSGSGSSGAQDESLIDGQHHQP